MDWEDVFVGLILVWVFLLYAWFRKRKPVIFWKEISKGYWMGAWYSGGSSVHCEIKTTYEEGMIFGHLFISRIEAAARLEYEIIRGFRIETAGTAEVIAEMQTMAERVVSDGNG